MIRPCLVAPPARDASSLSANCMIHSVQSSLPDRLDKNVRTAVLRRPPMKSSAILLAVLFLVTCGLLTTPHSHAADPPAGTGGLVATVTLANGQPAVNI